jgi:LmbE family N-acetylglucosaminyl deacetylase
MLSLPLHLGTSEPLRVLAIGAHADDVEIGAGGTVMRLLAERPAAHVKWVVASGAGTPREDEARASACELLAGAGEACVSVWDFRDGFLPFAAGVKERFEDELKDFHPHLILTHGRDDRHQDHRLLSDLTWNTFRNGALIAEYEVPKWDGDLGQPNAFVRLDDRTVDRKVALLERHFRSQAGRPWFGGDTFRALARLRGVECGAPWAEAFECRKVIW